MRTELSETDSMTGTSAIGAWNSLDFDLHGLVGIRLLNASPREVAVVRSQLGLVASPLNREPDIVVRFVDRLSLSSPVRYLGLNDAGFTDDAFLVLRSRHKVPARVVLPVEALGGRCEITCERGLSAVPLLIAIINLTVLAKGGLAVHASAFRHQETGVLVVGWSKGGKTEMLLGFMVNGAEYVGDEWIYLDGQGERMLGIPEPIRVWDCHLEQLPEYWRRLDRWDRARLRSLRYLAPRLASAAGNGRSAPTEWRRYVHRLADLLERQRYVRLSPRDSFDGKFGSLQASLHRVVLVVSHDSPETTCLPVDPAEVADRMAFSLQEERSELMSYYRKFRFAFPHRINPLLEGAHEIERERLRRVLETRACHVVHHPYPPSIPDLVTAVLPLVEAGTATPA